MPKLRPLMLVVSATVAVAVAMPRAQDPAPAASAVEPFEATVRSVVGTDLLVLDDGRRVRLQGISIPTRAVRPPDLIEALRARIEAMVAPGYAKRVWVFPDASTLPGDDADVVAVVRSERTGISFNEQLLAEGLAVFNARTPEVSEFDALVQAARRGQEREKGWWGRVPRRGAVTLPYLNGAVLPLHGSDGELFRARIAELRGMGFRHVCLSFSTFVDDVRASRIDRHHPRTVSDEVLLRTIGEARSAGMTVLLLPIVLLLDDGGSDWRGVLRPRDEQAFWIRYDRMLSHYLDLAEWSGVEALSVGSEFSSLEDRQATWRRLVANARGRFRGLLTYSANWDHVTVSARWFDALDFVGMTAYFSLTEKDDPSPEELAAAWRRRIRQLDRSLDGLGRPVVITELGYCSQDGANQDPWNYTKNRARVDLAEQADCFAAFLEAVEGSELLRGAYWYEFYEEGGPRDPGYTPRGKPALELWKAWAGRTLPGRIERRGR